MQAGEGIMRSPGHPPKDLDAALMYAPPWARRPRAPSPLALSTAPDEEPAEDGEDEHLEPSFVGDRAMMELRRRLSLDPDWVPEPPMAVHDGLLTGRLALRASAVASIAAVVAWVMITLTAARPVQTQVALAEAPPPAA